jgi:hypothetical protein
MSTDTNKTIFRFKFSPEINDLISHFAKLHQYDDRHTYKEQWEILYSDNEEIIEREISRLHQLGYIGDIKNKMYKAGRYYFRKKVTSVINEPHKRRNYISMDSIVLETMDNHIRTNLSNTDFSPATGYDNFCSENKCILSEEILRLKNEGNLFTKEDLITKIKKTYKNRYFSITH